MLAQVLHRFEGPRGLVLEEIPEPAIEADDEVLLDVVACGVCHRDITYSYGKFGGGKLPTVLGHEAVGRVADAGDGVVDLAAGDRVVHLQFPSCGACEWCRGDRPQLCRSVRGAVGEVRQGAYAARIVLPRHLLVRVPDELDDPAAAIAGCAIGTAYHALRLYGFEPRGRTVAVNGAAGGVGIHAIQVAKALGARVVAVTSSEEKEDAIRRAGADEVVVAPGGRYRLALSRLTDRRGVDLFLEVVGAPTLQESVLSVAPAGRVVVTGNPEGGTCVFNPALLILRGELRMYGTLALTARELEAVLGLMSAGEVRAVIDTEAPLADLPEQMRRMEARATVGRVVVRT